MDTLKAFLKSLDSEEAREAFAARCGTTLGHMRNASYGLRPLNQDVCAAIERESAGAVPCEDTRPDLHWGRRTDKAWPWHKRGRPVIEVTKATA